MSKRKLKSEEERWRKKIKKYEAKLRRNSSRIIYSSDEEIEQNELSPIQTLLAPVENEQLGAWAIEGGSEHQIQNPEPVPGPSSAPAERVEPAAQQEDIPATEVIDAELLQALGDVVPETDEWGDAINDNLAKIWSPILKDGLKKEVRDELTKKYLPPKNCPLAKSPILNLEIAAVLLDNAKNRDTRVFKKQSQLGCVLSVLGKIITGTLKKTLDTQESLKLLSDASKLVADSHFNETETRRALIMPTLEKSFVEPFKDRKRDSHLFGENLGEFIKSSTGIKKTGQLIQAASNTAPSGLNWRGPPPRQFQRYTRLPLNRSGGQRAPAQAPTRQRPSAPTPATTRAAPAPPARQTRRDQRHNAAPTSRRR